MKKVLITGPESSGKSFLAEALSEMTKGVWVNEFAREYLEKNANYREKDLLAIAKGQKESEYRAWNMNTPFVFSDTGIEVVSIWSEVKYARVNKQITNLLDLKSYDAILLCRPNIPWYEDPLREHPKDREYLFNKYKEFLNLHRVKFSIIDKPLPERVKQAVSIISLI